MDDMHLLRQYADQGSEAAFSELVSRHIHWVFGVCRRRVGDPGLAEDVTQAVFIVLAKKAGKLPPNTVLAGWLTHTARYAAADALKLQARRRRHERRAAEMKQGTTSTRSDPGEADELLTHLDEALARLSAGDRDALALRFYARRSLADVGAALGLSEEAARKRVSRGLEKMRAMLSGQAGVPSVAVLASTLTAASAQAAPAGLQAAAHAAAMSGQAGAAAAIAQSTMQLMVWAKVKVAAAIAVVALAGAGTAAVALQAAAPARRPPATVASSAAGVAATAALPVAPANLRAVNNDPAAADDDFFTLDDGAGFSRRIDRRLLRFTQSGGAFARFHLVIPVAALPGKGNVSAEVVIERNGESAAMLVRSIKDGLPYAYLRDGVIFRLDPASRGTVLIAEGVHPDLVLHVGDGNGNENGGGADAGAGNSRAMTEIRVAAGERKRILVDLGGLIEGLQRRSSARSFDGQSGALKLSGPDTGGRVMLVSGPVPGVPPVREFNVSETVRLAVGAREIRVDPLAATLPQVSQEMGDLLSAPVRHVGRAGALGDLLPPAGFFDDPANRAAAAQLATLIAPRGGGRSPVGLP